MTVIITKSLIGKEDLKIQTNIASAETFERQTSTGGTITLTKIPDIWDGTGLIKINKILIIFKIDLGLLNGL